MSLAAVVVLTVVVLVTVGGWLLVVFRAGSGPARRPAGGADGTGDAADVQPGTLGQALAVVHDSGSRA